MIPRLVLDTNVLLRGLTNMSTLAGRLLAACEKRLFVPVISLALLEEYRDVLTDPRLAERLPSITHS